MSKESKQVTTEIKNIQANTYQNVFRRMQEISQNYGNMPIENIVTAFSMASPNWADVYSADPYIQNRRIKSISTLPGDYSKDKVAEMIRKPLGSEKPLREIAHGLEYTSYPLYHTRAVYQNLLTYHNYFSPFLIDEKDVKDKAFFREWRLIEKLKYEFDLKAVAHEITGECLQEGKVFYYPRYSVDKSHNKVNYAFMQQLPSDYIKIIGFNNKSKYTLAFNMMYFAKAGTNPYQYGDLFTPYLSDFTNIVKPSRTVSDLPKVDITKTGREIRKTEIYNQNGTWYYWVELPAEKVFTFEIDDTNRNVVSPFTGLFIDMIQLSQLSAIQLELVQNPLVSVLTGEIPYFDTKDTSNADQYKLSNTGREVFLSYWYQMLSQNNTNGIGIYAAPFQNMTLHNLAEAPSAMDIVSKGYSDTMAKAGLNAIIPTTADARAGAVNVSLQIESKFAQTVYAGFERMMKTILENLNLKYEWKFTMFGDIASDEMIEKQAIKGMEDGFLADTLIYLAMHDRSLIDDITISSAIMESGVLDMRIPLITSYSAKNENGLPPQPKGRPETEGTTSEGKEGDIDSPKV